MAEPLQIQSPWGRIVALSVKSLKSGLADAAVPNHVQNDPVTGETSLNRFYGSADPEDYWHSEPHFSENANQFGKTGGDWIHSGHFTGEMRSVIQDHLARGVTVEYSDDWNNTNGIFVAGNGDRYVVQIEAGTVYAWKMVTRQTSDPDKKLTSLGYIPGKTLRPTEDYHETQNPNGLITMTVPGMLGHMGGKSPWHQKYNWAFSDDGHKCAIVLTQPFTSTDNPATGGLTYYKSFLYEIDISEVGFRPSSASITEVASDWLYGDRITQLKYPDYANDNLISWDWFGGNPSPPWNPATPTLYAPIHTFYEGGTRRDVYYSLSSGSSVTSGTGGSPSTTLCSAGVWVMDSAIYGSETVTTGIFKGFDTPIRNTPSGTRTTGYSQQMQKFYDRGYKGSCYLGGNCYVDDASIGGWAKYYKVTDGTASYPKNDFDGSGNEVLVLPFMNREAYFLHYSTTQTSAAKQTALQNGKLARQGGEGGHGGNNSLCGTAWGTQDALWLAGVDSNLFTYSGLGGSSIKPTVIGRSGCIANSTATYATVDGQCETTYEGNFFTDWTDYWAGCTWQTADCWRTDCSSSAAGAAAAWCTRKGYTYVAAPFDSSDSCGFAIHDIQYKDPASGDPDLVRTQDKVLRNFQDKSYVGGFTYDREYYGEQGVTLGSATSASQYGMTGYVGGTVTMATADATTETRWTTYLDGVDDPIQWMVAVEDAEGVRSPIYCQDIMPDGVSFPTGLTGDAKYPYTELLKIWPQYVGKP